MRKIYLRFSLGSLLLFVLFAASVVAVYVRRNPWVVERVQYLDSEKGWLQPPDFKYLTCQTAPGATSIFFVDENREIASYPQKYDILTFPENLSRLLIGDRQGNARIWERQTGKELCSLPIKISPGRPSRVVFSSDGLVILIRSQDQSLNLCNTSSGAIIYSASLSPPDAEVEVAYISPDNKSCAMQLMEGSGAIWEFSSGEITTFAQKTIQKLWGYSPDGKMLLISDVQGLGLWNAHAGQKVQAFELPFKPSVACYSPQGDRIAVCGSHELILDARSGKQVVNLGDSISDVIAFSPDGRRVVTTNYELSLVRIWSAETGQILGTFRNMYAEEPYFSKDGTKFYTYGPDDDFFIWSERFPQYPGGHFTRPEVWLAIITGIAWLVNLFRRQRTSRKMTTDNGPMTIPK